MFYLDTKLLREYIQTNMNKTILNFLRKIGKKGGQSKSEKKIKAALENLKKIKVKDKI